MFKGGGISVPWISICGCSLCMCRVLKSVEVEIYDDVNCLPSMARLVKELFVCL
jgi:hypothetical protein